VKKTNKYTSGKIPFLYTIKKKLQLQFIDNEEIKGSSEWYD